MCTPHRRIEAGLGKSASLTPVNALKRLYVIISGSYTAAGYAARSDVNLFVKVVASI
jgi:hypothetical protein